MPEPNSMMLLGSGVVPVPLVVLVRGGAGAAQNVKASEGIVPTVFSEAEDGPEFSSQ